MVRTLLLVTFILAFPGISQGQHIFYQPTDGSTPAPLPPEIRDRLSDPFLQIVLDRTPQPNSLESVTSALLEGGRSGFDSFVVGEQLGRPEPDNTECGLPIRRSVISFNGTHASTETPLDGNVFLSVFLTPAGFQGPIEVLAWDAAPGAYNYYKFERGSWRFRNSSDDLAMASPDALGDGCLACHVNGGPIMKELTFPWNNWHSLSNTFVADYLRAGASNSWPVASGSILNGHLADAQRLETIVESALKRFSRRTIEGRIETAADGRVIVNDLPNLLASLFRPTELNLGSSNTKSGLDRGGLTQPTNGPINIPDSFFINIKQMRDIDLPVFRGLGAVTTEFTHGELGLSLAEYEAVIEEHGVNTKCMPGPDTVFAWFGPEPSEFDRRMIERMVRLGVIDRNFVAAALAVDHETPLFSPARASLLAHAPKSVTVNDRSDLPAAVTTLVIESLSAIPEAQRSAADSDFLALLQGGDAVTELDRRIRTFRDSVQASLSRSAPATRAATLTRLFRKLMANRRAFVEAPISARQAEFDGLFPGADN